MVSLLSFENHFKADALSKPEHDLLYIGHIVLCNYIFVIMINILSLYGRMERCASQRSTVRTAKMVS